MSHGSSTFTGKDCCIYCKATNVRLTKEHIVPYFIGGQHVIERASCDACADITKKFEQDVARELWGDARNAAQAPSRRKKHRPKNLSVGHPKVISVLYSDYPATFVFYKMPLPGIMLGAKADMDISGVWKLIALSDDKKLKSFKSKHKTNVTAKFRHVPESFGRMIAKIGYGHILTQLDIADFEPIILPFILGEKKNISYVVGCKGVDEPPIENIGYKLSTVVSVMPECSYVIAEVRLLSNYHSPTYLAVVGRITSMENTKCVINKLGEGELRIHQ